MRSFLIVAAIVAASTLSGCASQRALPDARTAQAYSPVCDRAWHVGDAVGLEFGPRPLIQVFDASSPCLADPTGVAVTYAAYALPNARGPWQLRVESHLHGRSLFAPELVMLDKDQQVVRRIPHQNFVMRGKHLEATIFFKDENLSERYLLVRSATGVAGHGQVRVESSYFILPIFTGLIPFVYMQGTEREREFVLSHSGVVKLYAEQGPRASVADAGFTLASR